MSCTSPRMAIPRHPPTRVLNTVPLKAQVLPLYQVYFGRFSWLNDRIFYGKIDSNDAVDNDRNRLREQTSLKRLNVVGEAAQP